MSTRDKIKINSNTLHATLSHTHSSLSNCTLPSLCPSLRQSSCVHHCWQISLSHIRTHNQSTNTFKCFFLWNGQRHHPFFGHNCSPPLSHCHHSNSLENESFLFSLFLSQSFSFISKSLVGLLAVSFSDYSLVVDVIEKCYQQQHHVGYKVFVAFLFINCICIIYLVQFQISYTYPPPPCVSLSWFLMDGICRQILC